MTTSEMYMPAHVEAERVVLGAVLLENSSFVEANANLRPHHFSLDSHRRIWAAILQQMTDVGSVDVIRLGVALKAKRETDAVGGVGYLWDLTTGIPRRLQLENYIDLLREAWTKRELIRRLSDALEDAQDEGRTGASVVAGLQSQLIDLESQKAGAAAAQIDEFMYQEYERIGIERNLLATGPLGISTDVRDLDLMTTGYRDGELTFIGAAPGCGKTSLMLQGLRRAAKDGSPSVIFSLEMRKEQLLRRLFSMEGNIPFREMRDPRQMGSDNYDTLGEAVESLIGSRIWVADEGSMNAENIVSEARLRIRRDGVKIVFVDFIQIVNERGRTRREEIGKVSGALRQLAKSENVPVVVASQLARPDSKTHNVRPSLHSLRESGELEQDAHNVLLLHRPKDAESGYWTGDDEIIIAKQRSGIIGHIDVRYCDRKLIFLPRHSGGTQ